MDFVRKKRTGLLQLYVLMRFIKRVKTFISTFHRHRRGHGSVETGSKFNNGMYKRFSGQRFHVPQTSYRRAWLFLVG